MARVVLLAAQGLPQKVSFGLEVLSRASHEAKQAQREFARFAAGICEFHHE